MVCGIFRTDREQLPSLWPHHFSNINNSFDLKLVVNISIGLTSPVVFCPTVRGVKQGVTRFGHLTSSRRQPLTLYRGYWRGKCSEGWQWVCWGRPLSSRTHTTFNKLNSQTRAQYYNQVLHENTNTTGADVRTQITRTRA